VEVEEGTVEIVEAEEGAVAETLTVALPAEARARRRTFYALLRRKHI
jgi:hypothetical protein